MSTAAVIASPHRTLPQAASPRPLHLAEDACRDCGHALAQFEEHRCADCEDLALHMECRDCGRILADADLEAGACAGCLG
ncbi:hypothetical protein [Sinomonas atrocyanea]|uniref:hypothetical protein n=1 Tax=Sinomonas atrocyanea TaxID=37927 RepID=UPI003D98F8C4